MAVKAFENRVAIVTGAGRGLGRAYAMDLAEAGCRVIVNDCNGEVAQEVTEEILQRGGAAASDDHDVVEDADAVVARAIASFGRLDIVVNNAGVLCTTQFSETPPATWNRVVEVHLMGTVAMCRASWPHLLGSNAARIINVSSTAMLGNPGFTAYGAAKAGIFGFTRSLALEAEGTPIRVNCIFPTARTRMTDDLPDAIVDMLKESFHTKQVSSFVTWLAHPSTSINNEAFEVGAGYAARLQMALGPAVKASPASLGGWFAQEAALMAAGELTPVYTAGDLFGLEVARVTGQVGHARAADAPIAFSKVTLR